MNFKNNKPSLVKNTHRGVLKPKEQSAILHNNNLNK